MSRKPEALEASRTLISFRFHNITFVLALHQATDHARGGEESRLLLLEAVAAEMAAVRGTVFRAATLMKVSNWLLVHCILYPLNFPAFVWPC